jgi:hypothetical protein
VVVFADTTGTVLKDGGALGDAAFKNTGTVAGTLAAGNDSRIVGAASATALAAGLAAVPTLTDWRQGLIETAKTRTWLGQIGAFADGFFDQSNVDVSGSVNAAYNASGMYYYNLDPSTKLLCHFDGANGTTTTTDDAGHTLTMAGTAKLSTAYATFGSASLLCDGSASGGVTTGISTDFNFLSSSSPWTIEFVANPTATPASYSSLVQANAGAAAGIDIRCSGAALVVDNGTNSSGISIANTFVAGTKVVIAVTCDSTNLRVFTNGTLQSTTAVQGYGTPNQVQIGYGPNNSSLTGFPGYIDELRISNVCRYTASYTPATAAFVLSTPALDLRSAALALPSVPTKGSLFVIVNPLNGATITPQTNLIASISQNGTAGTPSYTQMTLTLSGSTTKGYLIYEANGATLPGTGQALKTRVQTTAGTGVQVMGVYAKVQ